MSIYSICTLDLQYPSYKDNEEAPVQTKFCNRVKINNKKSHILQYTQVGSNRSEAIFEGDAVQLLQKIVSANTKGSTMDTYRQMHSLANACSADDLIIHNTKSHIIHIVTEVMRKTNQASFALTNEGGSVKFEICKVSKPENGMFLGFNIPVVRLMDVIFAVHGKLFTKKQKIAIKPVELDGYTLKYEVDYENKLELS